MGAYEELLGAAVEITRTASGLASNGHIHDALLDLVRDVPAGRDYQSLIQARR